MKIFILSLVIFSLTFSKEIYVDNSISQNGNGNINSPFKEISKAFENASAGDIIYIRGDLDKPRQYKETLRLGDTAPEGTKNNPILVTVFKDEKVEIVPKGKFSIYRSFWIFENLIFDMQKQQDDVLRIYSDNLTFRKCIIRNGQRDGFDIINASNTLIEECEIYNFMRNDQYDAHGIILDGGTGNIIRNNKIYDCKGDCIQFYKENINKGTIIENNYLYTTLGGNSENAIDIKGTKGTEIRGNKMFGFRDAEDSDGVALKINKDSDNIIIENNEFYDSNGALRISGDECDNIVFKRNVVHNIFLDGDPSKYGYGIQFDGVNDIEITNNTFVNIPGPLFWIAQRGATNITMTNNLFYNTKPFKGKINNFKGTLNIAYNGWFNCRQVINGVGDITGFDPMFIDAETMNFRLKEESPAIDKGNPSSGNDFPGGRIDLGAFEYNEVNSGNSAQPENKLLN